MSVSPCPNRNEGCPLYETKRGCFADTHHKWFFSRWYRTAVEKDFRELPENKEQLCRAEHEEIHATQPPPEKPSREQMIIAIAQSALNELGETA